ncbi:MAG: hypothetical protein ACI85U_002356 [Candidatus Promineifilaceae bacterium]
MISKREGGVLRQRSTELTPKSQDAYPELVEGYFSLGS